MVQKISYLFLEIILHLLICFIVHWKYFIKLFIKISVRIIEKYVFLLNRIRCVYINKCFAIIFHKDKTLIHLSSFKNIKYIHMFCEVH